MKFEIKNWESDKELNSAIKKYLKKIFPNTFVSIRQHKSSNYHGLNVTWYQFPSIEEMSSIMNQFLGYTWVKNGNYNELKKLNNPYPFTDINYDFRDYDKNKYR